MPKAEPFIYDLALKIEKERDPKKIRVLADRLLQLLEKRKSEKLETNG